MQAINFYGNLAQFRPFITGRDTDDNELISGADWLVPGPSLLIAHSVEEFGMTRDVDSLAYFQRNGSKFRFPEEKPWVPGPYLAFTNLRGAKIENF